MQDLTHDILIPFMRETIQKAVNEQMEMLRTSINHQLGKLYIPKDFK